MDYKQKYEQALERAKVINPGTSDYEVAVKIFPELKESEDERIRKEIIQFLKLPHPQFVGKRNHEEWIAWLEKQSESKPACQLDNSRSNVSFPFKAKVKSSGKIVMIYDGQLSHDGKEWIKYQSDRKDGYKIYEPDSLELVCNIEQKSAEQSEEDEEMITTIIYDLERHGGKEDSSYSAEINWLKSIKLQKNVKYIDVEKLKAEIDKRIKKLESVHPHFEPFVTGRRSAFQDCLNLIDSLQ